MADGLLFALVAMGDIEYGNYRENAVAVEAVKTCGACAWVFLGFVAFTVFVSYFPVSGVTEAPAYAKTLLYLSVAHHFDDVKDALGDVSPPPPSFL